MSTIISGNLKSVMKQEMCAISNDIDTINERYKEIEKDIQIIKRNLARKSWRSGSLNKRILRKRY